MTTYSAAIRVASTTGASAGINVALATLVATATNKPTVLEIGYSQDAGNASQGFVFGRPSTNGTGADAIQRFVDAGDGGGAPALTTIVTEWDTSPGLPTQALRRSVLGSNVIGTGFLWTFARGLSIPASGQLGLFITTQSSPQGTGGAFWATIDE